jgi:hypothetical protein
VLAYGLKVPDLAHTGMLVEARDRDEEAIAIRQVPRAARGDERGPVTYEVGDDHARFPLFLDAWLELDRVARAATFVVPRNLHDDELVHPGLGLGAAMLAEWSGRLAFHGGAFVARGGAWAVVGRAESGKSTVLATLSLAGVPVLSDDLLVIEGGALHSGPRCLDLRPTAVAGLALGNRVVAARNGLKSRLPLAQVPAFAPLRGWVFLEWGDAVRVARVSAAERIPRIAGNMAALRRPRSESLLDLATLPAWELRRPRRWEAVHDGVRRLLACVEA